MNSNVWAKNKLVYALKNLSIVLVVTALNYHAPLFADIEQSSSNLFQSFPHTKARLVSSHTRIIPNQTSYVGLHLILDQGWHTYWKNPGDSGAVPILNFSSPDKNLKFGDTQWPNPIRINSASLTSFAYEKEVLLSVPVSYTGKPSSSRVKIQLDAEWLVCKKACVPAWGSFSLSLELTNSSDQKRSRKNISDLFDNLLPSLPQANSLNYTISDQDGQSSLIIQKNSLLSDQNNSYDFYLASPQHLSNKQPLFTNKEQSLAITFDKIQNSPTEQIEGTLHIKNVQGDAYISFSNSSEQSLNLSPLTQTVSKNAKKPSLILMLCFAMLGGILLNLMPCVFPIISLKMLSLVNANQLSKKEVRTDAGLFILGCLSSFLSIAFLIVGLKTFGVFLGWGFQLQSPTFIITLSFIFTILALSFIDLIHIELPGLSKIHPGLGSVKSAQSFFAGFLAVLLATPCSAPFMGVSIGYALGQNTFAVIIIFTALALGFSAPYLYILAFPRRIPSFPNSGPWLKTFKNILFFPMLATVIWLTWIYGQLQSIDKMFWLLIALLFLSSLIFILKSKRTLNKMLFVILIGLNLFIASLTLYKSLPKNIQQSSANNIQDGAWLKFTPEVLEEQRQLEKHIFLDFTADWCLTCKVNESLTLENKKILQFIDQNNIVMMKADWTRYDPVITDFLKRYDRASIPFYLFYPKGKKPLILPELLTPTLFMDTISNAIN